MPTIFPELRWAQRSSETEPEKNKLWITVAVSNLKEYKVDTTDTTFKFTGKDAERDYAIELELFAEIDASLTREAHTAQSVVVELRKKEAKAEYWPRLAKDKVRRPFIRTDFDKWVDEDEQEEAPEEDPMAALGGMGGGGFPGAEGLGGLAGLGGGAGGAGADNSAMLAQLEALQKQMGAQGDFSPEEAAKLVQAEKGEESEDDTKGLGEAQD